MCDAAESNDQLGWQMYGWRFMKFHGGCFKPATHARLYRSCIVSCMVNMQLPRAESREATLREIKPSWAAPRWLEEAAQMHSSCQTDCSQAACAPACMLDQSWPSCPFSNCVRTTRLHRSRRLRNCVAVGACLHPSTHTSGHCCTVQNSPSRNNPPVTKARTNPAQDVSPK